MTLGDLWQDGTAITNYRAPWVLYVEDALPGLHWWVWWGDASPPDAILNTMRDEEEAET